MGDAYQNIIVTPCIVKSWLYASGDSRCVSACVSWTRMISASMPPRIKKTSAVTRYRLPIVLWSTVASTPKRPGGVSHVRVRRSTGAVAMGARVATTNPLLERLEVRGERLQVARRHRHVGHVAARLDRLCADDPPHQIGLCVRQRARSD